MTHADVIDRFLVRTDKDLAGAPTWVAQPRGGEFVATWQVLVGRVLSAEFEMRANAYPNMERNLQPYFKLGLYYMKTPVCRLDFQPDKSHTNKILNRPQHIPSGIINGEHWHSFDDNKTLFEYQKLPTRFDFAVMPPLKIAKFEQAFHWFCDTINASHMSDQVPDLPNRTILI